MKNHDLPIFDFRALFGASGDAAKAGLANFREMQQLALDVWLGLGLEGLRFVSARLDAQAGLLEGLRGCTDAASVGEKEAQFFVQSADEYRKVVTRIGEITREAGDRILSAAPGAMRNRKAA